MLKAGTILGERYEIVGRVGSGGMADVYKAKDHKLNRFVAVKVMKQEFNEDGTFISKFRREAQAAAGLANPNIVNVYDVGEDQGNYYIVMELVEGITLKEYIGKKGQLSVREATSIAIQVCMGLHAAHAQKIVHRDVKPENITLEDDLTGGKVESVSKEGEDNDQLKVTVSFPKGVQAEDGYLYAGTLKLAA
ncbi:MAG: protein kinase domain-containing protein, partial [bacterium]